MTGHPDARLLAWELSETRGSDSVLGLARPRARGPSPGDECPEDHLWRAATAIADILDTLDHPERQ